LVPKSPALDLIYKFKNVKGVLVVVIVW
jgi:hypothetical protein